jgi:hypothetical protein
MSESPERPPLSTRAAKAARRWLPIAIIGVLLAGAGVAATFMLLVRPSSGPELTSKVPRDIDVYVEVPSVDRLVASLGKLRYLDVKKLDVDRWVKDAATETASSLDIPEGDAKKLLESVDAMGLALRLGAHDHEAAILVRFKSDAGTRLFLGSSRFVESDDAGTGGKRYFIDHPPEDKDGRSVPVHVGGSGPGRPIPSIGEKRGFFGLPLTGKEIVAHFKEERIVVLGHELLIDDIASVLKGKHSSLEENEGYQKAKKDLPRGVAAFAFVDTQVLSQFYGDDTDYFMKKPEPIVAALSFVDAGSRFTISGGLSGKMIPPTKAYTEPVKLSLAKRLPKETVGYLAASTKLDLRGDELEEMVLDKIDEAEPRSGKRIRADIAEAERDLGMRLTSIYDALGDEGIIAVAPAKSYKLDITKFPRIEQDYAVAYLQHVDDVESAKRIVRKAKETAFPQEEPGGGPPKQPYHVRADEEGGFSAEPDDPTRDPYVMAKIHGQYVMAAIGRREVCERFWTAFLEGTETLGDDDGHADALGAMPRDAHAYLWVDTAQLLAAALDANPGLVTDAQHYGLEPAAVKTTGEERLTTALSLGVRTDEDEVWRLRLDALNATEQIPVAAFVEFKQSQMRSRTVQARSIVQAIAAAANGAYRSNRFDWRNYTENPGSAGDRLCKTAAPVPAAVPVRTSYLPSDQPGEDWNSGDERTGWKCLKFALTAEQHFQFTYNVGGSYKGPARGGPDPGPAGFEVAAEGDQDGDGKTSLFTVTGTIDPTSGDLTLATTVFASDELE